MTKVGRLVAKRVVSTDVKMVAVMVEMMVVVMVVWMAELMEVATADLKVGRLVAHSVGR